MIGWGHAGWRGAKLAPASGSAVVGSRGPATVLVLVLLAGLCQTASGQKIVFRAGSPSLTVAYDWTVQKAVGAGSATAGTATFTVSRGRSVDVPYTITVDRQLAGPAVGLLSFTVSCPTTAGGAPTSVSVTEVGSGSPLASAQLTTGTADFSNIQWAQVPSSPTDAAQGAIKATCYYGGGAAPIDGDPVDVIFSAGNTVEVRGSATLTDAMTWPTWSLFFPAGGWLTTPPSTAVTSGSYPSAGTTVKGPFPVQYQYTYTISNTVLCFAGAQVSNVATLVTTGSSGTEQRTYKSEASVLLTVTDCDVKPSFTIDQPNLQTSLTYAWTQSLTPLSASAITVPWGGGGAVQAQAVFTRTVTAATFQASFTLTITNPAAAPIAITNLQLACPWGGNTMLPCGSVGSGFGGAGSWGTTGGGSNSWLVIPASNSITCMVNMLPLAATWGADFTQPCTLLTSNWLGTQATFTGLVLNFEAPQRWQTINNCAQWSVSCTVPTGNSFYVPAVSGGLPSGQQVCGGDQSNAPLPPQPFSVAFSGGWIGDGTQPAACASSATTTCTSSLQLQSTAGTTQTFGGTQTNTLSLQATPVDCPKPPPSPVLPSPVLLPSPSPAPTNLFSLDPLIVAQVTRTYIRGTFAWTLSTELSPTNQAVLQGSSQGVNGRYTVIAAPQAVPGTETPQYQLEGVVTVTNPDSTAAVRVDEVFVVVDTAAVALGCRPGLPGILSPGARVDCGFLVNYNQGGLPNAVRGRATLVSDWNARRTAEGAAARFSFDNADVTNARGACARVHQTFATNFFDLVQMTGVAPSFTASEPTTVCSPATWAFDVRFTPREGAPCGNQQAIQTVTAQYSSDAQGTLQASSTANLFVIGTNCPPAPADYVTGSNSSSSGTSSGQTFPPPTTSSTTPATSLTGQEDEQALANPPPGLSVVLSRVESRRSDAPGWDVTLQPVNSTVTFKPGTQGAVPFKLSWSRTKPLSEFSGTVTVINNAADAVELDGLIINLMESMGSGDATAEGIAECPVGGNTSTLQPLSGSHTHTLAARSRTACNFTLHAASSGSLVGTATTADGGDAVVSKGVAVTSLMQDGDCAKLVSGTAASELGEHGVLLANSTTLEEEVCGAGSKVVQVVIPADAKTDRGCTFPVVAMAWMQAPNTIISPGSMAHAKAEVAVAGCSTELGTGATVSVTGVTLTKGRALHWVVSIATDPPAEELGEVFDGERLVLTTTWQQRPELGLRLNVSGEVAVEGTSAASKAMVTAIPLCPSVDAQCDPVAVEAKCKPNPDVKGASRCVFNLSGLPLSPGLLLASVDEARPAAAQPYDIARARYALTGSRWGQTCAVLTQERTLEALDGAPEAKVQATGAALPTEPVCDTLLSRNATIAFDGIQCEDLYAFTARAEAAPVTPGAAAVSASAELAFNVTCV